MSPKKKARQERSLLDFFSSPDADAAWRELAPLVRSCGVDTRLGLVCLLPGAEGRLRLLRARLEASVGALLGSEEAARVGRSWRCVFGDAAEAELSTQQLEAVLASPAGRPAGPRTASEAAATAERARRLLSEPGWARTASSDGGLDVPSLRAALRLPAEARHVALGFVDVPQPLRTAELVATHADYTRDLGLRVEDVEAACLGRVIPPLKPCYKRRSPGSAS
jgi:hypothetical protein